MKTKQKQQLYGSRSRRFNRKLTIGTLVLSLMAVMPVFQGLLVTNAASEKISTQILSGSQPSWLNLKIGSSLAEELSIVASTPLSLAAADFDEDGIPDLLSGYATPDGGLLSIRRGNVDAIYPRSPEAKARKKAGEFFDTPFFAVSSSNRVPFAPDFLGAGDFDADGHWDAVVAAKDGINLFLFRGDGRGSFAEPESIALPGRVTALLTGDVNRRDGLTDLLVAISVETVSQLLVFEHATGALRAAPEMFALPVAVTGLAMGQLDKNYEIDLVAAGGDQLVLIHGRDRRTSLDAAGRELVSDARTEVMHLGIGIESVAVGDFAGDFRDEIATLGSDNTVRVFDRDVDNWRQISGASTKLTRADDSVAKRDLIKARVSSLPKDDLVILDSDNDRLDVITSEPDGIRLQDDKSAGASDRRILATAVATEIAAVLQMRLNESALNSLVVFSKGSTSPTVLNPTAAATVIVNSDLATNTRDAVLTLNEAIRITNGTLAVSALTAQEQAQVNGAPANPGLDTIHFNIPGDGVPTIVTATQHPSITDALILDGTTQPAGKVAVESATQAVLHIMSGNTTVRGMVLNQACRGLQMIDNGGNIIEGNFIGTNIDGTAAGLGNSCNQIEIGDSTNNIIGGTTSAARNVLSGVLNQNNPNGVFINGPNATGNSIVGNHIGPDVTGSAVIGNSNHGVFIAGNGNVNNTIGGSTSGAGNVISGNGRDTSGAQAGIFISDDGQLVQGNIIGLNRDGTAALASPSQGIRVNVVLNTTIGGTTPAARNVISGNGTGGNASHGIQFGAFGVTNCIIQGNYIGTNATGTAGVRNLGNGIDIPGGSNNNVVGGAIPGAGNLISGNILDGVNLRFTSGLTSSNGNQVQGNFIGTDWTGTVPVANEGDGIEIASLVLNTTVGGTTAATRNLISGNRENGIRLNGDATASPNRIEGNNIGTNTFGTGGLGNGQNGIFFPSSNIDGHNIGGTAAGQSNVIAFNGGVGVGSATGRQIGGPLLANSIFSNDGLGIDRESNGPSANGSTRTDNAPQLTSVVTNGGTTIINGTLQQNHTASVNYTVQFYSNVSCDTSGFGEGRTFIGQTTVPVTNNQPVAFSANISPAVPDGRYISAIAVGPSTSNPATAVTVASEFSFCGRTSGDPPPEQTPLRIFTVAPNRGGNTGPVSTTITGEGIQQGAVVALRKSGESEIVGSAINIATSGTSLTAVFDLAGRQAGVWDVVVTNPDAVSITLASAFMIEAGRPAEVWADIVGRSTVAVFPPHDERYFLIYGNRGNVDAPATMLRVYVPEEMEIRFVEDILGSQPVITRIDDGSGAYTSGKYIEFYLPKVEADSSATLMMMLRPRQINRDTFNLRAWGYVSPSLNNPTPAPDPTLKLSAEMTESTPNSFGYNVNYTSATRNGTIAVHGTFEPVSEPVPPTIVRTIAGDQITYTITFVMPAEELPPSISSFNNAGGLPLLTKLDISAVLGDEEIGLIAAKAIQLLQKQQREGNLVECLGNLVRPDGIPVFDPAAIEALTNAIKGGQLATSSFLGAETLPFGQEGVETAQRVTKSMNEITNDMTERLMLGPQLCDFLGGQCAGSTPEATKKATEEALLKLFQHCPGDCPSSPPPTPTPTPFHLQTSTGDADLIPASCPFPGVINVGKTVVIVTAIDPNDKAGPSGNGEQNFVKSTEPFRYEIMFENLPTATAAAKQVIITDQLDMSKFDISTFSFDTATFGSYVLTPHVSGLTEWSTDLDLRPARHTIVRLMAELNRTTGVATWRFIALDPLTGEISTEPDGGFLPPNQSSPEGSGAVFFTIKPKVGLAEGTQLLNHARIVFDGNAPIDTPQWLNTIDNLHPTSQVQPLATTQVSQDFVVNWSGIDTVSGISGFNIWVSEDGGPFFLWLNNISTTSAVYSGRPGSSYGFYSISTDGAGNAELPKTTAEAVTLVLATISGRVTDLAGRGLSKVTVVLTDGKGGRRHAMTNTFGYYAFAGVMPDATYTLSPRHKRYGFSSRQVFVDGALTGIDFVPANP